MTDLAQKGAFHKTQLNHQTAQWSNCKMVTSEKLEAVEVFSEEVAHREKVWSL